MLILAGFVSVLLFCVYALFFLSPDQRQIEELTQELIRRGVVLPGGDDY